jgi:hypothetical protein
MLTFAHSSCHSKIFPPTAINNNVTFNYYPFISLQYSKYYFICPIKVPYICCYMSIFWAINRLVYLNGKRFPSYLSYIFLLPLRYGGTHCRYVQAVLCQARSTRYSSHHLLPKDSNFLYLCWVSVVCNSVRNRVRCERIF